ncbi:MAG: hypothetical protein ABIE22_03275 [archaeon]
MDKLKELKKAYDILKQKYKLPSFKELNEEFDVERIAERETETLLREIRKVMMDKIITYLRFTELLLNPSAAPLFFLSLLKNLSSEERKVVEKTYTDLGKLEIDVLDLDITYSEKREAEFILYSFKEWQTIKKDLLKISTSLRKSWEKKSQKKDRNYLG